MEDSIILNGQILEISTDNNDDLKVKFLICPLDVVNSNGTGIKESDITDDEKIGLKDKAVVTKVVKDSKGNYDFSGHNMKVKQTVDKDGNVKKEYEFDTTAVGFHKDVYVEEMEIDGVNRNCIVAETIIWKRYPKVIEVIERLGINLRTSWETLFGSYYYDENGGKWIKDLKWLGNCMLGSNVKPAYKNSGALEIAEEDNQDMELSIATQEDLVNNLDDNKSNLNYINKGGNEMGNEKKEGLELSSISTEDLRNKIRSAIYATEGNGRYFYGILIYPYEFLAYAKIESQGSSVEDYVKFTYIVNSDDTISITAQEDVKMVFVPKTEYETEIANLKSEITAKDTEIASKVDEVVKLGEVIKTNETAIAEKESIIESLTPFKEQVEKAEAEAKEAEIAQAKEDLKEKALKSEYVTEKDIETSEDLKNAIESLDEKAVNAFIGQRVVEYASQKASEQESQKANKEAEVEVSTDKKNQKEIKIDVGKNDYKYNSDSAIFKFINK